MMPFGNAVKGRFGHRSTLAEKVDWDGGVVDAILGGLNSDWVPLTAPSEIVAAWDRISAIRSDVRMINDWLWDEPE